MQRLITGFFLSRLLVSVCLASVMSASVAQSNIASDDSSSFDLSTEEIQWIEENPTIKVIGDPDWFPFEGFNEQGQYIGIVAEVLREISRKTQLEFDVYNTSNWTKTLKLAEHAKADIISASQSNDYLSTHYIASHSTIQNPVVMVGKENLHYISNLASIKSEKVALLGNSGYGHELRHLYPDNNFIEIDSVIEGLLGVAEGKYDVVLLSMAIASYKMAELGLYQLRVVGITDVDVKLTLFVNNDKPMLWNIINKAKLAETPQQRQQILSKWIKYKYVDRSSFSIELLSFAIISFFAFLLLLWKRCSTFNANKYQKLAEIDSLTKLFNRPYMNQALQSESSSSERYSTVFSLILIDIDDFKLVNDSLGHEGADKVLQKIALLLTTSFDKADVIARWGGKEFLVLCPRTNLLEALDKAKHFQSLLADTVFHQNTLIKASVGISQFKNKESIEGCLNHVDAALYRAKELGGDRIESF